MNDKRKLAKRYELGDLIGRGGMAEVFEAVDTRLNRTVAIKILRDRFEQQFLRLNLRH